MTTYEALSYSFNGADGVGKTTLATRLAEELSITPNGSVLMKGTGFQEWDLPEFADRADELMSIWKSGEEFVRLPDGSYVEVGTAQRLCFQYIATRCYARAKHLTRDENAFVVIDSDPYLKGLMWSRVLNLGIEVEDCWHEIVASESSPAPDLFVNVSVNSDENRAGEDALARIRIRGDVSEFDPKDDLESLERVRASIYVRNILLQKGLPVVDVVNSREETDTGIADRIGMLSQQVLSNNSLLL